MNTNIRELRNEVNGKLISKSVFNKKTGNITRMTITYEGAKRTARHLNDYKWLKNWIFNHPTNDGTYGNRKNVEFDEKYNWWVREEPFSYVPESIDLKITDWCNFGCSYCYMNSTTEGKNAPFELIEKVFEGLKEPPLQIAIGGGEPLSHPKFCEILQYISEKGSVPNVTTAGHIKSEKLINAIKKYCGGVSITLHWEKWKDKENDFIEMFEKWQEDLEGSNVQLNIQLVCNKDAVDALNYLYDRMFWIDFSEKNKKTTVILLAYEMVGRQRVDYSTLLTRTDYMHRLPCVIKKIQGSKNGKIAFSEGLLPFFNSRADIVNTDLTMPLEGDFTCFVDMNGDVYFDSFSAQDRELKFGNIYEDNFQEIWTSPKLDPHELKAGSYMHADICGNCAKRKNCVAKAKHLYNMCAFQRHNIT